MTHEDVKALISAIANITFLLGICAACLMAIAIKIK